MITINIVEKNDLKYLTGKIGNKTYTILHTEENKRSITSFKDDYNAATSGKQAKEILEKGLEYIHNIKQQDNKLVDLLDGDLKYDSKKDEYYVKLGSKISKRPVHKFFVDKMIEASDKELSPKPWLMFWVRLMRNPLYRTSSNKVENLVDYLKATYTDKDSVARLVEEGFSEKVAEEMSKFDQISITENGILAPFKYVDLITKKFVVEKLEDGTQEIKKLNKYEQILEVDEDTGEVLKEELELPEEIEDLTFLPSMMQRTGDPFTCRDFETPMEDSKLGHIVKVGHIHELPGGFSQVNTNDNSSCVKGLHLGGYYYVQGFGGKTSYLVDCLVAPEDIGAVCDLNRSSEGAIRCKRYMVTGGHFKVSRGMYHPSTYGEMLDKEWEKTKQEVIKKLNEQREEINTYL